MAASTPKPPAKYSVPRIHRTTTFRTGRPSTASCIGIVYFDWSSTRKKVFHVSMMNRSTV